MHGAAHMLNLWLPRGGGVLEIWHYGMDEEAPVMFRNAAIASGKFYNYLSVRDPAAVHIENRTDFAPHWQFHEAEIEVDVRSFAEHFDAVLQAVEVLQRRPLN